jgi:hypothetical protein
VTIGATSPGLKHLNLTLIACRFSHRCLRPSSARGCDRGSGDVAQYHEAGISGVRQMDAAAIKQQESGTWITPSATCAGTRAVFETAWRQQDEEHYVFVRLCHCRVVARPARCSLADFRAGPARVLRLPK